MTPLVSVCIGAYNRERYIRETLDSVFAQTYPNLEVIVVDDASTDRTVEIVQSYGDRVKLIRREVNSGICPVTRNQAARAATGAYLAFLDSDDKWYPDKTQRQVEFLESHRDVPLCHTYCHIIDESSQVVGIRHEGALPATGRYFEALLRHCVVTVSSVMMRRELFDAVGGYFIEDRRYGIWGEEHEFLLRVAARYPIGLVPDVLAAYRRGTQNIARGNWKYYPESVPFHRLVLHRPDLWRGVTTRDEVLSAFVGNALENAQFWRDHGYPGRSLFFALAVLCESPFNGSAWSHAARSLVRSVLRRGHAAGVMERT
ncbi:MAG TPA: glycosyltransferase [Kiritimatiellia bacterium]|nr:glycosyltransferase [Kiritimatiellia bacterium]